MKLWLMVINLHGLIYQNPWNYGSMAFSKRCQTLGTRSPNQRKKERHHETNHHTSMFQKASTVGGDAGFMPSTVSLGSPDT